MVKSTNVAGAQKTAASRLFHAVGLSAPLCLVLASRVFVTFDTVRIKIVQNPIAALEGHVQLSTDQLIGLDQLAPPFAVIARLRHDSPTTGHFEILIDGRVVCSRIARPGATRRVDCAWSGDWNRSRTHQVTVSGPPSRWTLDYLEFATHHGATRAHDLVILPAASRHYTRLDIGWIAATWIAIAIILLLPRPARIPRPINALYTTTAVLIVILFTLVAISRLVSPYTVLLSWKGFLRAVCVLLAPRLWGAGLWLVRRPLDAARTTAAPATRSALWVLAVSGVLGFRVGIVGFPDWQVAVETAQVVAGVVTYPPGNPFYIYHTKLWTGLHQVGAVFLLAGVSEITLSMIISGLLGMVSFQALSLVVYALSGDALLAIGSAFLVFVTGVAESGVVYPIFLMGTTHTYGALGLSMIALVAGLLGAGCHRTGGFLLGITPAVHPPLGVWFALIVALAVVWDFKRLREERRPALAYFLAGCGLSALSLAVQLVFVQDAPPIDPELAGKYLSSFVGFWDGHRRPVDFNSLGVAMNVGALALALIWLTSFVSDVPRSAMFLLRMVAVSAALSLALAFISRMPPEQLPAGLIILMPGRLLNFNALIFPALVLGLIGAYRKTIWGAWLVLFLTPALLLTERSRLWTWIERHGETIVGRLAPERPADALLVLAVASLAVVVGTRLSPWDKRGWSVGVARVATLGLLAWVATETWQLSAQPLEMFLDRTNNPVFSSAAKGRGMLVTSANLQLVQLRTRRPVLLDGGGLDGLPYALEAGPEMERILRDVYAIDLFNPPEEARGAGAIPRGANRTAWEHYSAAKWQQIRETYSVTQVLAYADWKLALPVIARDNAHVLYEIPHSLK